MKEAYYGKNSKDCRNMNGEKDCYVKLPKKKVWHIAGTNEGEKGTVLSAYGMCGVRVTNYNEIPQGTQIVSEQPEGRICPVCANRLKQTPKTKPQIKDITDKMTTKIEDK